VHAALGPGFLEGVYGRALLIELKSGGLAVEQEKLIKIWYGSQMVGRHRLDLVIEGSVIVELKANRGIVAIHAAQMRSYLQATGLAIGILLNFGIPDLEWELIRPAAYESTTDP
jgi:GxxExxY protein